MVRVPWQAWVRCGRRRGERSLVSIADKAAVVPTSLSIATSPPPDASMTGTVLCPKASLVCTKRFSFKCGYATIAESRVVS